MKQLDCLKCPDFPCDEVCPDCGGQLDYNDECPGWYEDDEADPQPYDCPLYYGEQRHRGLGYAAKDYECDSKKYCKNCPSLVCKDKIS